MGGGPPRRGATPQCALLHRASVAAMNGWMQRRVILCSANWSAQTKGPVALSAGRAKGSTQGEDQT